MRRRTVSGVALAVLSLSGGFGGGAVAQPGGPAEEIPVLEARAEKQRAMLEEEIREISVVGVELEESQAQADVARARSRELGAQAVKLRRDLALQKDAFQAAKANYEEKARAAYKGGDLEGLTSVLGSLLGSADGVTELADTRLAEALFHGKESLEAYADTRQHLQSISRQVSGKERDYRYALEEERRLAENLRQREKKLEQSIARLNSGRARTEARLQELRAAERERVLETRPATGGMSVHRSHELEIARQGIVARPVGTISKKQYQKLYIKAARDYGFGSDWYVLAAVGKVESDHGTNMGPSTAGAMGPMQFLPSTWEAAGVDGNGDGVANIMDPEDAIPAAARYLRDGGAPGDWYRALYTYNHADWYVKKVLAVAEAYRRLADDNGVRPYF